jgi:hypothetical protein
VPLLAPDVTDLRRRRNLLMPLLQAVVAEQVAGHVQLPEVECQHLLQQRVQGGDRDTTQQQLWEQLWEQLGWRPDDLPHQVLAQKQFGAKAEATFLMLIGVVAGAVPAGVVFDL